MGRADEKSMRGREREEREGTRVMMKGKGGVIMKEEGGNGSEEREGK